VAWASPERRREAGNRSCFLGAPEICVEVVSPSNSDPEIREKVTLYVAAAAEEVWLCGDFGTMTFFDATGHELERSKLCPEFPNQI
jgi:Uma2 family endonuclease